VFGLVGEKLYTHAHTAMPNLSKEKLVAHLIKEHKPQSNFKTTNVFVGDSSHKVKTYDNSVPRSSERSLVILILSL